MSFPLAAVSYTHLAVLDENDQTVLTAQAAPNTAILSFTTLDSSIRFGELPAGNYTYMVVVTDSQGDNLCFTRCV